MNFKHGKRRSAIYGVWQAMKTRCSNARCPAYPSYGGRGISVCKEWHSFDAFYGDMGERPDGCSLERVDNNKGYLKDNCIWASRTAQGNNKRNNVILNVDGVSKTVGEWAAISGIPYATLHRRVTVGGMDHKSAVETPLIHQRNRNFPWNVKRRQTAKSGDVSA